MSWAVLALLSAVTAALVAIFGKMGLDGVDSTVATAVRAGIMFATLLVVVAVMGRLGDLRQIGGRPLLYIVLAGMAGAASWIFYFWALKLGPASKVAPLDRLSLVFVVLLAALFLGEKLALKGWLGALLMSAGAVLIALP